MNSTRRKKNIKATNASKKRAVKTRKKPITRKKPRKNQKKSLLKRLFKPFLLLLVWATFIACVIILFYVYDLPSTDKLSDTFSPSITVVANNGDIMANIGGKRGNYLKYNDFPAHLINAVVATEDRRFFKHFGIDVIGLVRAFYVNSRAGYVVQGGSTITQQLAKIVFLSHQRTIKRKVQELLLSFWLERKFSKQEIITMYLNRVYLGAGNYGVDAASRSYFGKSASDMNLYESALIAGLLKAPSKYSPFNDKKLSIKRSHQVLANMVNAGYISTFDAVNKSRILSSGRNIKSDQPLNVGLYFADWIVSQISEYVGVQDGNLKVKTTIDPHLQKLAEKAMAEEFAKLGKNPSAKQGALLVLSNEGEILAMVGGRNYKESQFNRATQALRQPGSTFKLFTYLAALEKGVKPEDIYVDEPVTIDGWSPKNYYGKHEGEMSVKESLAKSINTIAIKLSEEAGRKNVIKMARRLGVSSPLGNQPSIVLGSDEVTLLEMVGAYGALANSGRKISPYGINEIKNISGDVLYKRGRYKAPKVLDKNIIDRMNDMLINVVENGTGKNAAIDTQAAGKTGTSQNSRDAWFIGYTSDLVAGVWVGNDDDSSMENITGGGLPAKIWRNFMSKALANKRPTKITSESIKPIQKPTQKFWDNIYEQSR